MDEKDDFKNNEDKNIEDKRIEVVVGDTSELSFSEVGDYIGDLRPKDVKGSKKNIIIPTNKKNINSSDNGISDADATDDDANKSDEFEASNIADIATKDAVNDKDNNNIENKDNNNKNNEDNSSADNNE